MEHAINTGLIPLGEKRNNVVVKDSDIEAICDLISKGYSTKEICNIINIPNCNMRRLVQNIKNGHCRKNISSKYDFSNMNTAKRIFSEQEIRIICSLLEKDRNMSTIDILKALNINYYILDNNIKSSYNTAISSIRNKKTFIEICNEYNY